MIVTSTGIHNGKFHDKYGKKGEQFNENGIPSYSIPLKFEHVPEDAVSFALVLEDKDAYPVTGGFSWIHWLAANITRQELYENDSLRSNDFVQGVNSWTSIQGGNQSKVLSSYYGGMAPPDSPHLYEVHVYALDTELDLQNGFFLNELYRKMEKHIVDQYTLKAYYDN
ncbi:YbhB/YbcL family Raf kinase inhibitor-like protein [Ureibacillus sinduriensis]|uniref:Phosphatidylethanolamine-binding protein n=1 Tax=Ureibacillus sinduriensis BLB-1 = JCM 15800 TaxID=1384057 RepID=A0A0A3I794_9BACL|nr:YbhB/YbcL family Raf kinase inhibitor-like protein [Ureibacillus sinduriensis]KGR78598.1 phosphatidylethanolamine-binding protein [Ureibacillus sinduriensis BLB-1 = JCM 15800]